MGGLLGQATKTGVDGGAGAFALLADLHGAVERALGFAVSLQLGLLLVAGLGGGDAVFADADAKEERGDHRGQCAQQAVDHRQLPRPQAR